MEKANKSKPSIQKTMTIQQIEKMINEAWRGVVQWEGENYDSLSKEDHDLLMTVRIKLSDAEGIIGEVREKMVPWIE